jgi:hypothetical protein
MSWLDTHFWQVLSVWSAVNVVLSNWARLVPPAGFWGKLLHVLVAVSPLDVVKAVKVIGAEAVPPMTCLALFLLGCVAAGTPAQQADVAAYGAESNACVATSPMRPQYNDCLAAVRARWCGPNGQLADAGACFYDAGPVVVLDAGVGQ